jgi:hypothetical protein
MSSTATGEYPVATLSGRTTRPARNAVQARDVNAKQLLSEPRDAPALSVDFRLVDGERVSRTIKVEGKEPVWLRPVMAEVQRITRLGPGWDSYGARPLRKTALLRFLESLLPELPAAGPTPAVVPTRDGGIQLEWHRGDVDFEIEVPADENEAMSYALFDRSGGADDFREGSPARHSVFIRQVITRLMGPG